MTITEKNVEISIAVKEIYTLFKCENNLLSVADA